MMSRPQGTSGGN